MAESEAPEDIRTTAFKIANGWSRNDEECADMQADIERALLSERKAQRERCAQIAEQRVATQRQASDWRSFDPL